MLLSSNMGLSIFTHYCGGRAVSSIISFSHQQSCCKQIPVSPTQAFTTCSKEGVSSCANTCCQDELLYSQNTDDYRTVNTICIDYSTAFTNSASPQFNFLFEQDDPEIIEIKKIPPLLKQKDYILFQSFLI